MNHRPKCEGKTIEHLEDETREYLHVFGVGNYFKKYNSKTLTIKKIAKMVTIIM